MPVEKLKGLEDEYKVIEESNKLLVAEVKTAHAGKNETERSDVVCTTKGC